MVESIIGGVKIRIGRGIDLAVRDVYSSDPYAVINTGSRRPKSKSMKKNKSMKMKTRVVKSNCNPVWNEEFILPFSDPTLPIKLSVFDHDTFSKDDAMGEAEIDIRPYLECLELGLRALPMGTAVKKVQPSSNNCLADESKIIWVGEGRMVQNMILKLNKVERGMLDIQIEWVDIPGAKGLSCQGSLDIYY